MENGTRPIGKVKAKLIAEKFDTDYRYFLYMLMIKIELLKKNPHHVPAIANIWYKVLAKVWMPEIQIKEIETLSYKELNQDMPLT